MEADGAFSRERVPSTHVFKNDGLEIITQQSSEPVVDIGNVPVEFAFDGLHPRVGQAEAADRVSEAFRNLCEGGGWRTVVLGRWSFCQDLYGVVCEANDGGANA